jgi:hypothetical protein
MVLTTVMNSLAYKRTQNFGYRLCLMQYIRSVNLNNTNDEPLIFLDVPVANITIGTEVLITRRVRGFDSNS